jgi:hypothetical protein
LGAVAPKVAPSFSASSSRWRVPPLERPPRQVDHRSGHGRQDIGLKVAALFEENKVGDPAQRNSFGHLYGLLVDNVERFLVFFE